MNELLERLDDFTYEPQETACDRCDDDFKGVVKGAQKETQTHFEGLCLDCMNKHKAKTYDEDTDYWYHNKIRQWDQGCRVTHGEPTWYFSFMGRREKENLA